MSLPARVDLHLDLQHTSPLAHPQVVTEQLSDDELRRRIGEYVRTMLMTHPEIVTVGWPVDVWWDELRVVATLTRGELVIPATWRRSSWWSRQKKSAAAQIVESLAGILTATQSMYADADETGRVRRGDLVLEPGVREEGGGASPCGVDRYCRIGEDVALPLDAALEAGWVTTSDYGQVSGDGHDHTKHPIR